MQLLLATASIMPESRTKLWNDLERLVEDEPAAVPDGESQPGRPPNYSDGVLVLDLGEGKGILVDAAHITHWTSKESGELPVDEFRAAAAAWKTERRQTLWRLRLAEEVIAFSDELGDAMETTAVAKAVTNHIPRIVESFGAALLLDDDEGNLSSFGPDLLIPDRVAILSNSQVRGGGVFFADRVASSHPLHPLFELTGAASILSAPTGASGVLLVFERRRERVFEPEEIAVVRTLAIQAASFLQRIKLFSDVRALSLTDPLTGLGNRRHLDLVLRREVAAARRGEPLSLVLLDLDYFKEINDTRGHAAGDMVLREFADELRAVVRASDVVIRYGGDEFLVVLVGGTAPGAASLIRRLRKRSTSVTFSVGISEYDVNTQSAEHLIDVADQALYEAKRRRPHCLRNQTVG